MGLYHANAARLVAALSDDAARLMVARGVDLAAYGVSIVRYTADGAERIPPEEFYEMPKAPSQAMQDYAFAYVPIGEENAMTALRMHRENGLMWTASSIWAACDAMVKAGRIKRLTNPHRFYRDA